MAGEFGISSDEVINLLRQMDVPVRSHLTLLTDDQVSPIRARWEREKRARAERLAQAAAPATTRRRRGAAEQPVTAPAPTGGDAAGGTPRIGRRVRPAESPAAAQAEAVEAPEVGGYEPAATERETPIAPEPVSERAAAVAAAPSGTDTAPSPAERAPEPARAEARTETRPES